jgi:hypothetical protein
MRRQVANHPFALSAYREILGHTLQCTMLDDCRLLAGISFGERNRFELPWRNKAAERCSRSID